MSRPSRRRRRRRLIGGCRRAGAAAEALSPARSQLHVQIQSAPANLRSAPTCTGCLPVGGAGSALAARSFLDREPDSAPTFSPTRERARAHATASLRTGRPPAWGQARPWRRRRGHRFHLRAPPDCASAPPERAGRRKPRVRARPPSHVRGRPLCNRRASAASAASAAAASGSSPVRVAEQPETRSASRRPHVRACLALA